MKTGIKILQLFIMICQISIVIIPFIIGLIWYQIKCGFESGIEAGIDMNIWISNTE